MGELGPAAGLFPLVHMELRPQVLSGLGRGGNLASDLELLKEGVVCRAEGEDNRLKAGADGSEPQRTRGIATSRYQGYMALGLSQHAPLQ